MMTVRLANDMGMKLVAEYAERFGVYDKMNPYIAMSLGSGETTVMRMVSAYSVTENPCPCACGEPQRPIVRTRVATVKRGFAD